MKHVKLVVLLLTICSALCSGGCVWVAATAAGAGLGVGTYAFVKGELEVVYPVAYQETWSAALAALDALELTTKSADKDAFSGRIKAERATGKSIRMKIAPVTSSSTSVKIRVGTFGDRAISDAIAAEIEAQLKK